MEKFKNILMTIGGISLSIFVVLLVIGIKVVSTILLYIVGTIVAISFLGICIYYIGKWSGKKSDQP